MYIKREKYTDHIDDPVKKIEIKKVLDKIEIVLNNHTIESTDFLDPYEIQLAKSVLNRFSDLKYFISGGYKDSERKVILIYPEYILKEDIDFPISSLSIEGDLRDIEHGDYLGAILNLGLNRNKVGDILVYNDYGIVIVKEEISEYIMYNLQKVKNKNTKVLIDIIDNILPPPVEYEEKHEFLASLRLDSIISASLNLSRKKSTKIIKSGDVKVNFETIVKSSKEINEGDLISVKHFGRFILYEIKGRSKSNRIICVIRAIL